MRIAIVSHSALHVRQLKFYECLAETGKFIHKEFEVLAIGPSTWAHLTARPYVKGNFKFIDLQVLGNNIYQFGLIGLEEEIRNFAPDILYVQDEVNTHIAQRCLEIGKRIGCKNVVFVWENLHKLDAEDKVKLAEFDLCICGNDDAALIHHTARRKVILPQVGVDTDHFQARPDIDREYSVAFVGRAVPEKGIEYLKSAWPTAKITPWTDWVNLPWLYSQIKVAVSYSQDTTLWREQAMPYSAVEAMSCGASVVVSNGGSIPFWMQRFAGECPGMIMVPQGNSWLLKKGIEEAKDKWEEMGAKGRNWVCDNLSSHIIANKLVRAFEQIEAE